MVNSAVLNSSREQIITAMNKKKLPVILLVEHESNGGKPSKGGAPVRKERNNLGTRSRTNRCKDAEQRKTKKQESERGMSDLDDNRIPLPFR